MTYKHSSPQGRDAAKSALRHLVTKGEDFIHEHPLFGQDEHFPKTVATIKELATQLNAGSITHEEADIRAEQAIEAECEEHLAAGFMPSNSVMSAMFGNLAGGIIAIALMFGVMQFAEPARAADEVTCTSYTDFWSVDGKPTTTCWHNAPIVEDEDFLTPNKSAHEIHTNGQPSPAPSAPCSHSATK